MDNAFKQTLLMYSIIKEKEKETNKSINASSSYCINKSRDDLRLVMLMAYQIQEVLLKFLQVLSFAFH